MSAGRFPDWAGALVYYLRNHADMLDPVGGGAVLVTPKKASLSAPAPPGPIVVLRKEPGMASDYVPLAYPRAAVFCYHSTEKNAEDLMSVVIGIFDVWNPRGNGFSVQMPASLDSEIIRFNSIRMASTPFTEEDEGWPFSYAPFTVGLHAAVRA